MNGQVKCRTAGHQYGSPSSSWLQTKTEFRHIVYVVVVPFSIMTAEINLRITIFLKNYAEGRKGQESQWCMENEMKGSIFRPVI